MSNIVIALQADQWRKPGTGRPHYVPDAIVNTRSAGHTETADSLSPACIEHTT